MNTGEASDLSDEGIKPTSLMSPEQAGSLPLVPLVIHTTSMGSPFKSISLSKIFLFVRTTVILD